MAVQIYAGNLPYNTNDEALKSLFEGFGEVVSSKIVKDRDTGRSKGFGFVTFKNDDDAKKAIEEMNDKEVEGRALKVNEAKPLDPDAPRRPRRDFGNGGGRRDSRGPRRDFGGNSGGNRRRF